MTAVVEAWTPAFPGQRPPFTPEGQRGNQAALQHGAESPRRVDPVAQRLVDDLVADPGTAYLRQASYGPAVWAWARQEARVMLLDAWLLTHAEEKHCVGCETCEPKAERLLKYEKTSLAHRSRLGLDPLSRARLGRQVAAAQVDMARLLSGLDDDGDGHGETHQDG